MDGEQTHTTTQHFGLYMECIEESKRLQQTDEIYLQVSVVEVVVVRQQQQQQQDQTCTLDFYGVEEQTGLVFGS